MRDRSVETNTVRSLCCFPGGRGLGTGVVAGQARLMEPLAPSSAIPKPSRGFPFTLPSAPLRTASGEARGCSAAPA